MKNIAKPQVMGILNITPDSFSDGSVSNLDLAQQLSKAKQIIAEGADIIDIGGESTRPGAEFVSEEVELTRVIPLITELRKFSKISISVDTNKSRVAEHSLKAGANIINDITALTGDNRMVDVIARYNAKVVLMHMQGTPKTMQDNPSYEDAVSEILSFLKERTDYAVEHGVDRAKITIDPGFGFGKSFDDNCAIMNNIDRFVSTNQQVLIGISRKSMIAQALGLDVSERVEASVALAVMSYLAGAQVFRVHDVLQTRRALDMVYRTRTHSTE